MAAQEMGGNEFSAKQHLCLVFSWLGVGTFLLLRHGGCLFGGVVVCLWCHSFDDVLSFILSFEP